MKVIKIIAIVLVCAIVVGVAAFGIIKHEEVRYVEDAMKAAIATINDGTWQNIIAGSGEQVEEVSEAPPITFEPGTYGGVDFNSFDDVANYYATVYNNTKAQTAEYIAQDGGRPVFYAMVGTEKLELKKDSLLIDGKANQIINGMVPGILGIAFSGNIIGLPPAENRDPNLDEKDGMSFRTSMVVPEDIENAAVVDNGDGTITLTIVPKEANLSAKGMDAQGHFFNSLGALDSAVEAIGVVTWAEGTTQDNVSARYKDGSAVVKVDVASGTIVEADYHMIVKVDVTHATIGGVVKDKSASLTLYYDNHFPEIGRAHV